MAGANPGDIMSTSVGRGSVDNTTYWTADFDRQHYLDMFFNGLADQNGESVKQVYEEMSSGQYTIGFSLLRCIKYMATRVAFTRAMLIPTITAGVSGKRRYETPTVAIVSTSSAPNTNM